MRPADLAGKIPIEWTGMTLPDLSFLPVEAYPLSEHLTLITPKLATRLLDLNTENRSVSGGDKNKYVSDMRNGRWLPHAAPIQIGRSGILRDGQHRLLACEESNVAFWSVIVYEVPDESMSAIDIGKTRSTTDHLSVLGFSEAKEVAPVVSAIHARINKVSPSGNRLSKVEALNVYKQYESEIKEVIVFGRYNVTGMGRTQIRLHAYLALQAGHDIDVIKAFWQDFHDGIKPHVGYAPGTLSERIKKSRDLLQGGLRHDLKMEFAIRAYNAWYKRENLSKLIRPAAGSKKLDVLAATDEDTKAIKLYLATR